MTSADSDRWRQLFGQVVVMCSQTWDEAQSKFYFDGLKEFPFDDVQSGVRAVMETHKWPKVPMLAEFRTAIYQQRFDRHRDHTLRMANRRLTEAIHCEDCRDTGMRENAEGRHEPCPCRDSNPNYQVGRARQRLSDDTDAPVVIPATEAKQIERTVRDFKLLSSGE